MTSKLNVIKAHGNQKEQIRMSNPCLMAMTILLLNAIFAVCAFAQTDAVDRILLNAGSVPTNVTTVHMYPDPPQGFNPLTATDEELVSYGFPRRPVQQASPDHYALWERAMQAAKIRWHGDLKAMNTSEHPPATMPSNREVPTVPPPTGPSQVSNINAAGVSLNNTAKTFGKGSFDDIWTTITVPTAQLPFDNTSGCAASDYFSVSYAAFDGGVYAGQMQYFYPGEQAGVMEYVICSTGQRGYLAVVGWGDIFSSAFSLNPGDIFYTEVHAFGGCNSGSAFVEDLTTLTYNSYSISNPCLSPQIGKSANWVVDRICCNGPAPSGAWPLSNTISISFEGATVRNGNGASFYPGSQATTTQVLTMTDDGGDQAIELVSQGSAGNQGLHSLSFVTTGCAYTGGCIK
jgi:hypothetical protein